MSKYTADQVREAIESFSACDIGGELTAIAEDYATLLRERESAKATVTDDLDYVPGELDRTAPVRIWLQIDTVASSNDREEPWPGCDDVTWQDESIGGLEIQYVRADLVVPMLASARVPESLEVAGYVDPDQVRSTQQVGGSVGIGSFSSRYGRTVPVYWDGAADPKPETEE